HWGYTEEDALRYLLHHRRAVSPDVGEVVIRLHPAEPQNKYEWLSNEYGVLVRRSHGRSLIADILDCDVVAGPESTAMVIGLLLGKRVISCIPPGGKACSLPHSEIEHLNQLVAN